MRSRMGKWVSECEWKRESERRPHAVLPPPPVATINQIHIHGRLCVCVCDRMHELLPEICYKTGHNIICVGAYYIEKERVIHFTTAHKLTKILTARFILLFRHSKGNVNIRSSFRRCGLFSRSFLFPSSLFSRIRSILILTKYSSTARTEVADRANKWNATNKIIIAIIMMGREGHIEWMCEEHSVDEVYKTFLLFSG